MKKKRSLNQIYEKIYLLIEKIRQADSSVVLADKLEYYMKKGCWNSYSELLEEINILFVAHTEQAQTKSHIDKDILNDIKKIQRAIKLLSERAR